MRDHLLFGRRLEPVFHADHRREAESGAMPHSPHFLFRLVRPLAPRGPPVALLPRHNEALIRGGVDGREGTGAHRAPEVLAALPQCSVGSRPLRRRVRNLRPLRASWPRRRLTLHKVKTSTRSWTACRASSQLRSQHWPRSDLGKDRLSNRQRESQPAAAAKEASPHR